MAESMYPPCPKCGKGTLLPFFNSSGENIYVCTHCLRKFGPLDIDIITKTTKGIDVGGLRKPFGYCEK